MEIDVLDILISSAISTSALVAYIYYERKRYRPDFLVQKFYEPVEKPIESDWSIKITHSNMEVRRCNVQCDGSPCPWWNKDEPYYERTILLGNAVNIVRLPKGSEKDNAEIRIKDGNKTIRKKRLKDIPAAE